MQFFTEILPVALFLAGVAQAADPKANEYKSTDCSGDINFPHHSTSLTDVTMDSTTNSVYLAGGMWRGYTEKGSDGCSGTNLGNMPIEGCNTLELFGQRVNCVHYVSIAGRI